MTDVKKLLDEATPLPWHSGKASVFDDDLATFIANTEGADRSGRESAANAYLIQYAVNHLPAYERLRQAATDLLAEWDTFGPTGTQDTLDTHRRLREALEAIRMSQQPWMLNIVDGELDALAEVTDLLDLRIPDPGESDDVGFNEEHEAIDNARAVLRRLRGPR